VLARKCTYASGPNFLLLQFSAARAQGVSHNYVIHETQAPPHRRLRRARNFGLGRKLHGLFPEGDAAKHYDPAPIAANPFVHFESGGVTGVGYRLEQQSGADHQRDFLVDESHRGSLH